MDVLHESNISVSTRNRKRLLNARPDAVDKHVSNWTTEVFSNTYGRESEIKEKPVSPDRKMAIADTILEPEITWHQLKKELDTSQGGSDPSSENTCGVEDLLKVELIEDEEPISVKDCPEDPTSHWRPGKFHQRQIQVDEDEDSLVCYVCGYCTGGRNDLKNLLASHSRGKPYVCDNCDFKTVQLRRLKRHMMTHANEKPHSCNSCDFKSEDLSELKKHIVTHSGEQPFNCDSCEYKSGHKSSLKKHMEIHRGENPLTCEMCGYRTKLPWDFKNHMIKHIGVKCHSCELCDYKTVRPAHLTRHMKTHGGERPLACNMCGYSTGSFSHLQTHMEIH